MAFDNEGNQCFTHEQQMNQKRHLDTLKDEFLASYSCVPQCDKTVDEFDVIRTLGSGAYGVVLLVRDKTTLLYHAMKAIEKEILVQKKNVKQMFQEKNILQCANSPFVLNLDYCCKDNVYVYLVLPYAHGGELFTLMKKFGVLSEPLAQFYAAQVVLAIEYLHHCSVIHRDVKPENVLIYESGYVKLGDLGFSKLLKNRTWTLCGTPEYLAPEIIISKGYSFAADWWSLGVLLYEMNAGYPPFYHSEPMKLYEKVLGGQFKTPSSMSPQCKSLVKSLLQIDPTKRFGALKAGVFDIKTHVWFLGMDWNLLFDQQIEPPFIPVCKNIGEPDNNRNDNVRLLSSKINLCEKEFEDF